MALLVAQEMSKHDVDLRLGVSATKISQDSVTLSDGEVVPAEIVILAIGVRPDSSLAKAAGLSIGGRGGISVDENNSTSDKNIYALGDAAEKRDALDESATLVPLANIANRHGRVIADHINGRKTRHVDTIGTAIVKVFDLAVATTGWNEKRLKAAISSIAQFILIQDRMPATTQELKLSRLKMLIILKLAKLWRPGDRQRRCR